jgi:SAM-dependent methyltransferase
MRRRGGLSPIESPPRVWTSFTARSNTLISRDFRGCSDYRQSLSHGARQRSAHHARSAHPGTLHSGRPRLRPRPTGSGRGSARAPLRRYRSHRLHVRTDREAHLARAHHIIAGRIEQIPLADGSADTVPCVGVVEYLSYPERIIRDIRRVLKPSGVAIISFTSASAESQNSGTSAFQPGRVWRFVWPLPPKKAVFSSTH